MKPPRTVKVGPHTWRIERHDAILDHGNVGECDLSSLRIRYNGDTAPTQARSTILHELLHACYLTAGVSLTDRLTQEQAILRIEPLLLSLLRDNPAFLAWITE